MAGFIHRQSRLVFYRLCVTPFILYSVLVTNSPVYEHLGYGILYSPMNI